MMTLRLEGYNLNPAEKEVILDQVEVLHMQFLLWYYDWPAKDGGLALQMVPNKAWRL